ncbi:HAMP domain-containing sensor histidine kinase [Fulvivirgaceae bacterium BMA10]|uniref:histidine kinase n=1 Tax=Splendidivirga corallicola TaxID=3051826 RepID=A0ABT8KXQ1_9BACT|nr:HAMP domain-containing sensor histidine kinase [Fulvivirgaceae bacterium BMA10]
MVKDRLFKIYHSFLKTKDNDFRRIILQGSCLFFGIMLFCGGTTYLLSGIGEYFGIVLVCTALLMFRVIWLSSQNYPLARLRIFFGVIQFIVLSIGWFQVNGLEGSAPFVFIPFFIIQLSLWPSKKFIPLLTFALVLFIGYVLIEANFPELVVPYMNETVHRVDLIFITTICLLTSGSVVYSFTRAFEREQERLIQNNRQLEKLNGRLQDKNEELEQLAHISSHDLKTPLRGLSTLVDMIHHDHGNEMEKELKDKFALIKDRSIKMNEMINGILSYSKAGREKADILSFNLNELMVDVLASFDNPKNIVIEYFISPVTKQVATNKTQLYQVLCNLIGNAVKYHDKPKGKVEVTVVEEDQSIRFAITDDGPGIKEKYLEKIFDFFETAHEQEREDSTGIGLSIVRKLVEINGGECGVISEFGKGSTFWFTWENAMTTNLEPALN